MEAEEQSRADQFTVCASRVSHGKLAATIREPSQARRRSTQHALKTRAGSNGGGRAHPLGHRHSERPKGVEESLGAPTLTHSSQRLLRLGIQGICQLFLQLCQVRIQVLQVADERGIGDRNLYWQYQVHRNRCGDVHRLANRNGEL
jgi:hypothetical protein